VTSKPPKCKYDFYLNRDNKCLPFLNPLFCQKHSQGIIKVFFTPTDGQVFKEVLKFTLKHTKNQGISNTTECIGNST
jgi:hypothetical protein